MSRGIFLVLLLWTALSEGKKCEPSEPPSKAIMCYYEGNTPLPSLNICNCTHFIFTNAVQYKGTNLTFTKDFRLDQRAALDIKNLSLIFTLTIENHHVDVLKSDEKKIALLNEISAFLRTSDFNGVEINVEFGKDDVNKDEFLSFIKDLRNILDHHRVKRDGYSVTEDLQNDYTTGRYSTEKYPPKKSTKKVQKKSRVPRDTQNMDFYDDEEGFDDEPVLSRTKRDDEQQTGYKILLRVSILPEIIAKKYQMKMLSKYVDYFMVPTHMITDESEKNVTFHPSRLMGLSDMLNTDSVLDLLTGLGAPKMKIVVSMPANVLQYELKDAEKNTARSPIVGEARIINQPKMCSLLKQGDWTVERDEDLTAPYAFSKTTWLAFEDEISVNIKAKYILLRELAGAAVYPIDSDIDSPNCVHQHGGRISSALHYNFANLARKPRQVVLESLQEQIHDTAFFSQEAGVHLSEYRIVRVVDHEGAVHVIRKNTKTAFECSRQGYFSHPLGCNKFYRCVKFNQYSDDYTVFEYDCPAGLAFDERWEVCVWPGSLPHGAPCTGSSEIAPVPRSHYACPNVEGYYADPENCRWFFACLDHARDGVTPLTAYEFRCPFGLVFDENTLVCDWPWVVGGCGARGAAGLVVTRTGGVTGYEGAASFATIPDYVVSGGRIANKEAGVVLNQNIAGFGGPAGIAVVEDGGYGHRSQGYQTVNTNPGVLVEDGGSRHRSNGFQAINVTPQPQVVVGVSTPSSVIIEDGGFGHRSQGYQTVNNNPGVLVEDGGSRHRSNGFQAINVTPQPQVLVGVSTPSSVIVEDGGYGHRSQGYQTVNTNPGILVEDGGSRHRSNGFQAINVTPQPQVPVGVSTPSSVIVEDGGYGHRSQGYQTINTNPGILVEDGGSRHRSNGFQAINVTPQPQVLVGVSKPSSVLVEDGGSKHRSNSFQAINVGVSSPDTVHINYRTQGYQTPGLLVENAGSSHGSNIVQVTTAGYPSIRYGEKASSGYSYDRPAIPFELPSKNAYLPPIGEKPAVYAEQVVPVATLKPLRKPIVYQQPAVSLKQAFYQKEIVTPRPIVVQQQVYTVSQRPVVYQQEIVTPRPVIYQQEVSPVVYQQQYVTPKPVVYQQEIVQPVVTPKPVVYQQQYVTPKPVVYQQEIVQPVVTPKPVVYQQQYVTPKPVVYQQEIVQPVVTPKPVVYQQQYVTPKPVVYQQEVVTAKPVVYQQQYQQEIVQSVVTPKPVVYQQQYVTPKPVVYQQEVVTAKPVVYQQQYVTPKPVVYQQEVVTAKPVVYQQQYQQEIIQPVVTPKPVVYEQQYVTPTPIVHQQVQAIVTPKPVIYQQEVVTPKPAVYVQQRPVVYARRPPTTPKVALYQQVFNIQTPPPVTVRPVVSFRQEIVTPRPVVYQQEYVTPKQVVYEQQYQQEIVTPKPVAYEQKYVTPKPVVYQQEVVTPKTVVYEQKYVTPKPVVYQQQYQQEIVTPKPVVYEQQYQQEIVTPKPVVYEQKYITPKPVVYQQEVVTPKTVVYEKKYVTPKPVVYQQQYQQEIVSPKPVVYEQKYVTPKPVVYQQEVVTPKTVVYEQKYVTPKPVVYQQQYQQEIVTPKPVIYEQQYQQEIVTPKPVVYQQKYVTPKPVVYQQQYQHEIVTPKPVIYEQQYQQEIVTPKPVVYEQKYVTPKPVVYQQEVVTPKEVVYQQEYVTAKPVVYKQKLKTPKPVIYQQQYQQEIVTPKPVVYEQQYQQEIVTPKPVIYQQEVVTPKQVVYQQEYVTAKPVVYKQKVKTPKPVIYQQQYQQEIITPKPVIYDQQYQHEIITQKPIYFTQRQKLQPILQTYQTTPEPYDIPIQQDIIKIKPYRPRQQTTPKPTFYETITTKQTFQPIIVPQISTTSKTVYAETYERLTSYSGNEYLPPSSTEKYTTRYEIPPPPPEYTLELTSPRPKTRTRGRGKTTVVSIGQVDKSEIGDDVQTVLDKYSGKYGEISESDKDKFVTKVIEGDQRGTIKLGKEPEVSTVGYEITSTRSRGGSRKFTSTSTEVYYNNQEETDTGDISLATLDLKNLKIKKDKKTVIVVSQVSDANPILIGKLAGQCSCQSNKIQLRKGDDGDEDSAYGGNYDVEPSTRATPRGRSGKSRGRRPTGDVDDGNQGEDRPRNGERRRGGSRNRRPEDGDSEGGPQNGDGNGYEQSNDGNYDYKPRNGEGRRGRPRNRQPDDGNSDGSQGNGQPDDNGSSQLGDSNGYGRRGNPRNRQPSTYETSPGQQPTDEDSVILIGASPSTSTTTILPEVSPSILLPLARKPQPDSSSSTTSLPDRPTGRRIPSRSKARVPFTEKTSPLFSPITAEEIVTRNEVTTPSKTRAGAAFDRYGPGGWRSADETLQGSVDCKRPGLFRHPKYCNKFYSCNYDPWKKRYTLSVFNCPVHLAYDSNIGACNWPSKGPACADDNLLV